MMKKVIIFDFWGTLVEQGVYSPIKQVKRLIGLYDMGYSEFVVRFERAMMTRKFGSLNEAFVQVCNEFEIKYDEQLIEELIGLWNKNWLLAKPYEETVDVLIELKEKCNLILIANADNFSVDGVLEKFDLGKYFNVIILSYDVGLLKTDPKFYEKILERGNVRENECIAIGDSIHSDVTAANNADVEAVLVDRRDRCEFDKKIRNLNELLTWK